MSYEIKIENQPDYLKFTLSGTETLQDSKEAAELVRSECAARGYKCVLADVANVGSRTGLMPKFRLAEHLSKTGFNLSIHRLAVVYNPESGESAHFFETVCDNRAVNIRVFTDVDAAIQWLTE